MEKGANTRRRRLVERGTDRLAFITGQTRDLPSDGYPDSPLSTVDASSTQLSGQMQKSVSNLGPESQQTGAREETRVRALSYEDELFRKFKTGSAAPEIQPLNETLFPIHETPLPINETLLPRRDQDTTSKKVSHDGAASVQPRKEMEMRPRSARPSQSSQADNAGWSVETLKEILNFTPQEITKAISATESNRFLTSIAIAFLVVLSNWGLDIGGTITRVLVGTRPILFLILTNITIVIALLMENKDPNARGRQAGGNLGSADSLGQMLEIGLLLQKALGALLMDCSVCAVIMICFLGF